MYQCDLKSEGEKLILAPGGRCIARARGRLPFASGCDDSYLWQEPVAEGDSSLHYSCREKRRDQGLNISFKETFPTTLTSFYEAVTPDISSNNQWQQLRTQPLTWAGLQIQAIALW